MSSEGSGIRASSGGLRLGTGPSEEERGSGLWVTFEGGDGAGKTTQAALLQEWLEARGHRVVRTREPGGTGIGRRIREIVLHHRAGDQGAGGQGTRDVGAVGESAAAQDASADIGPRAEALLFAADRAHHIATLVRPALARGDVVIQDRYLDSSVAYQGAGRVLDPEEIRRLSLWATENALPDLTVLLDLPATEARRRLDADDKPFDRMEAERDGFHTRVREAFLALAAAEPERFLVLDAARARDELAAAVRTRAEELLAGR